MAPKAATKMITGKNALTKALAAIEKKTGKKPMAETVYVPVSTGSFPVDNLIGGSIKLGGEPICLGFPRRRITELFGPESSGKTTLSTSTMVQCQRAGGTCLFIDYEHAFDLNYARSQGLVVDDPSRFALVQPDDMEEGFKMAFIGIGMGVDMVVMDSVAAMVPKAELDRDFDELAKIGVVAAKLSQLLPKMVMFLSKYPLIEGDKEKSDPSHPGTAFVLINQTRAKIQTGGYGGGAGGGDDDNTTGGKALKFYASLRLKVQKIKAESIKSKDPITGKDVNSPFGNITNVKCIKNKMDGRQGHSTQIFIRFGTGVDDHYSVIESAVTQGLMKKSGSFYELKDVRTQGREKMRKYLMENPPIYQALKMALSQSINASARVITPEEMSEEDQILEGELAEMGLDAATSDSAVESELLEEV